MLARLLQVARMPKQSVASAQQVSSQLPGKRQTKRQQAAANTRLLSSFFPVTKRARAENGIASPPLSPRLQPSGAVSRSDAGSSAKAPEGLQQAVPSLRAG